MQRTPDTRLLFASRVAYTIMPQGGVSPQPPASYGLRDIETFSGGIANINAALIATADEGLILAFRGTIPPNGKDPLQSLLDWLNDAEAFLVTGDGLPGKVHHGFLDTLEDLWPKVQGRIVARAQAAPGATVYVTGHSKGGAVAFLAGMWVRRALRAAGLQNPVDVRTFAAARPGDSGFRHGFDAAFPQAVRTEYADDIVPHLPPELVLVSALRKIPQFQGIRLPAEGFVSAGSLAYYPRGSNTATAPEADSWLLDGKRFISLVDKVVHGQFDMIVHDHSIQPGSGYALAIVGPE